MFGAYFGSMNYCIRRKSKLSMTNGIQQIDYNKSWWMCNLKNDPLRMKYIIFSRKREKKLPFHEQCVHPYSVIGRGLSVSFIEKYSLFLQYTAKIRINGTKAVLWSKMPIFNKKYHNLLVLSHLCPPYSFLPLIRAFKWGTTQRFSSRGMKTTRVQS